MPWALIIGAAGLVLSLVALLWSIQQGRALERHNTRLCDLEERRDRREAGPVIELHLGEHLQWPRDGRDPGVVKGVLIRGANSGRVDAPPVRLVIYLDDEWAESDSTAWRSALARRRGWSLTSAASRRTRRALPGRRGEGQARSDRPRRQRRPTLARLTRDDGRAPIRDTGALHPGRRPARRRAIWLVVNAARRRPQTS